MQQKNSFRKNIINILVIIIFSSFISVITVLIVPLIIRFFSSVISGRIALIVILSSFLLFLTVVILDIINNKWCIRIPVYPLIGFMIVSFLVNIRNQDYSNLDLRWILSSISLPLIYISLTGYIQNKSQLRSILFGIIIVSLIIDVLLTFTDSNGTFPSLNGIFSSRYRAYMLGNQYGPIALASISSTLFLLSIGYLYLIPSKSKLINLFLAISSILALTSAILSGGRTAWISTIISLFLMFYFSQKILKIKFFKRPKSIIFGFLLFIGGGIFSINILNENTLERINSLITTLIYPNNDYSLLSRFSYWNDALKLFVNHPFGVGFNYFLRDFNYSPHNEYLNILLGSGLLGFILFYTFYFENILLIIKSINKNTLNRNRNITLIILICMIHISLISITESWSISNSFIAVVFWVLFSIGAIAAEITSNSGIELNVMKL